MFDYRNTDQTKIDFLENQSTGALGAAGLLILSGIENGTLDSLEGYNQLNDILLAICSVS